MAYGLYVYRNGSTAHRKKYYKALWSILPFKNPDELNILEDAMEIHLGLRYTTYLINCHLHHKVFNAVCKSTVNIYFLIIQPNRKYIYIIQQGTKNDCKWKEARQCQTKQWLIMLNRIPEDKR